MPIPARAPRLDRLHHVLLSVLSDQTGPVSTAELRGLASQALCSAAQPLVNEPVYRVLRTLHRVGYVSHHRPGGRHALWALTASGASSAQRIAGEPGGTGVGPAA